MFCLLASLYSAKLLRFSERSAPSDRSVQLPFFLFGFGNNVRITVGYYTVGSVVISSGHPVVLQELFMKGEWMK